MSLILFILVNLSVGKIWLKGRILILFGLKKHLLEKLVRNSAYLRAGYIGLVYSAFEPLLLVVVDCKEEFADDKDHRLWFL